MAMTSFLIYLTGSLVLALLAAGGLFLYRHRHAPVLEAHRSMEEVRMLSLLLWLASLSILAYIVFIFGKR